MRDPALLERLIREAVEAAEYGLGRDGCPFCGRLDAHEGECIAKAFGARDYDGEVHPERQGRRARPE